MLSRKCSRDEPVQNNRAFFNAIDPERSSVRASQFVLHSARRARSGATLAIKTTLCAALHASCPEIP